MVSIHNLAAYLLFSNLNTYSTGSIQNAHNLLVTQHIR
jgi:hypothetical protein